MKSALESVMQYIITAGWNKISDGDVNAPTGHFAIVEVPTNNNELADIVDAIRDEADGNEIVALCTAPRGWYLVVENDQGQVFVNGPFSEESTNLMYNITQADFSEWDKD